MIRGQKNKKIYMKVNNIWLQIKEVDCAEKIVSGGDGYVYILGGACNDYSFWKLYPTPSKVPFYQIEEISNE